MGKKLLHHTYDYTVHGTPCLAYRAAGWQAGAERVERVKHSRMNEDQQLSYSGEFQFQLIRPGHGK